MSRIFSRIWIQTSRDRLFGTPASNVYTSISKLNSSPDADAILCKGNVFNRQILDSYYMAMLGRWEMELLEKIIPANLSSIRSVIRRDNGSNSYDDKLWADISALKTKLAKILILKNQYLPESRNRLLLRTGGKLQNISSR